MFTNHTNFSPGSLDSSDHISEIVTPQVDQKEVFETVFVDPKIYQSIRKPKKRTAASSVVSSDVYLNSLEFEKQKKNAIEQKKQENREVRAKKKSRRRGKNERKTGKKERKKGKKAKKMN